MLQLVLSIWDLTTLAGKPFTMLFGGIFLPTTELAPTLLLLPIITPLSIIARVPNQTLLPNRIVEYSGSTQSGSHYRYILTKFKSKVSDD